MNNIAVSLVAIGLLVFLSHAFAVVFSKKRVPDVLLLMFIGIIIGPVLKIVAPSDLGAVGSVFTTVTLVVILFEGGTELKINTLRNSVKGTTLLTSLNFFVTMVVIGVLGMLIFKMNFLVSFMLGAILGGTSSAVVIPMVRQLNMSEKSKTILVLESAFSDVLCIVFALALIQAYSLGNIKVGTVIGQILASFVLATFMGVIGAIFWAVILNKVRAVQNSIFTTPAFVFIIYGVSEILGYSGAIASLAFGISLANIDHIYNSFLKGLFPKKPDSFNKTEKILFAEVVFLLKTFFFVYIGISIRLNDLPSLLIGLGLTILLFVLRIPVVRASMPLKDPNLKEHDLKYMSSMVPKGLAAAVLATIPAQNNVRGGEEIQNVVFAVILFSIIFTSVLIPLIENSKRVQSFYGNALSFNKWIREKIQKHQEKVRLQAENEEKKSPKDHEKLILEEKNEDKKEKNDISEEKNNLEDCTNK